MPRELEQHDAQCCNNPSDAPHICKRIYISFAVTCPLSLCVPESSKGHMVQSRGNTRKSSIGINTVRAPESNRVMWLSFPNNNRNLSFLQTNLFLHDDEKQFRKIYQIISDFSSSASRVHWPSSLQSLLPWLMSLPPPRGITLHWIILFLWCAWLCLKPSLKKSTR